MHHSLHRTVTALLDHTDWKGLAPLLRAGPLRPASQTDRHNPVLIPALRTVREDPTGVLYIPFSGSLHGLRSGVSDRAAFGLGEAFRCGDPVYGRPNALAAVGNHRAPIR